MSVKSDHFISWLEEINMARVYNSCNQNETLVTHSQEYSRHS